MSSVKKDRNIALCCLQGKIVLNIKIDMECR